MVTVRVTVQTDRDVLTFVWFDMPNEVGTLIYDELLRAYDNKISMRDAVGRLMLLGYDPTTPQWTSQAGVLDLLVE